MMETDTAPNATPEILLPSRRGYLPNLRPPWKPGQSGNPGGRKAVTEAMRLCRELTVDAVAVLKKNLKSKNEAIQLAAATKILEFAWGKPTAMDTTDSTMLDLIREQMVTEVRSSSARTRRSGQVQVMAAKIILDSRGRIAPNESGPPG